MSAAAAPRWAKIERKTKETAISVELKLDGSGKAQIETGIGFFDHMLESFAKHAAIDLIVHTKGDLHIDMHHTTEDVGIVLGQAIRAALAEKRGIRRYGHAVVPMDEALAECALDISGRPFLVWQVPFNAPKVGAMDTELFEEFFRAFAMQSGITLHMMLCHGSNTHHVAEACFKAAARALRAAVEPDARLGDAVPSTKGVLEA